MESKKVHQYYGKITPQKAEEGINAAIENATALYNDAVLLYDNKRFARAFSIAILCIEEVGKIDIIKSLLFDETQEDLNVNWKKYRTHADKNVMYDYVMGVLKGMEKFDSMMKVLAERGNSGIELDHKKQQGFYSNVVGKCIWTSPQDIIKEKDAQNALSIAGILVEATKKMNLKTAPELEVWLKHLKPHWKKDVAKMKMTLVNAEKELIEKGLVKDSEHLKMVQNFVQH